MRSARYILACVVVGAFLAVVWVAEGNGEGQATAVLFPGQKVDVLLDNIVRRNDAESLKRLMELSHDESQVETTRQMIQMMVRSLDTNWADPLVIPWLKKGRDQARPDRKRFYTYKLAQMGDAEAQAELLAMLREHIRTGSHPFETLGTVRFMRLKFTKAKPLIIELLKTTKESHVRSECMEYLFTRADENDLQTVLSFTADPAYQVRFWAYRTLATIGNKEAVEALKTALRKGEDDAVKVAVPVALGDIGTEETLKILVGYVRANDAIRGTYDWSSLLKTVATGQGEQVDEFLLEEAKRGSEIATDALVQRGNHAVGPILVAQLRSREGRRDQRAARGLAMLGHKPAVGPLRKMYENAPNARSAATPMICLAALGDKAAMEDLKKYILLTDLWRRTKPEEIEGLERFKKWVSRGQGDSSLSGHQDVVGLMCELGGPVAEYAFKLIEDDKFVQEVETDIKRKWLEQAKDRCEMALDYLAQSDLTELNFKKALSLRIVAKTRPDDPRTAEVLEKACEAFPEMPLTAHKKYGKVKREIALALEELTGKKHPYTIVWERGAF